MRSAGIAAFSFMGSLLLSCTDGSGECKSSSACEDADLCYEGSCVPALDQTYQINVLRVDVVGSHPDGSSWDSDGTPPDLWVEFGINEGEGCNTETVYNAYSASWDYYCTFVLPTGETFLINVWDSDGTDDEFGAGFYWQNNQLVELLRASDEPQTVLDKTGLIAVRFEITPTFDL